MKEGIACYQDYLRGLLDLTDNRVGDTIVPPPQVRAPRSDDPYLVVAADKGTATFSDYANGDQRGVRLLARRRVRVRRLGRLRPQGDGHHRARRVGVGEAPLPRDGRRHADDRFHRRRHRRHVGRRVRQRHAAVAAHPARRRVRPPAHLPRSRIPTRRRRFAERERLFKLPRSSWADYDAKLISPGGGVHPRSAKSIADHARGRRRRSAIAADALTPTELVNAILKAPVDLLYNGGIGTYVKAASETHAQVGDRANDALRVNGRELRCKVVAEGGNLGCTQLGRIEYALAGGRIYTDAIDNSAGVDTSDHEVNIKILLGLADRRRRADREAAQRAARAR